MFNTIFTLSALLFVLAMVVQILATQAFFNRLDSAHHDLYEQMGRPRWKIHVGDDSFRNAVIYLPIDLPIPSCIRRKKPVNYPNHVGIRSSRHIFGQFLEKQNPLFSFYQ